jgi:hypothetical protein
MTKSFRVNQSIGPVQKSDVHHAQGTASEATLVAILSARSQVLKQHTEVDSGEPVESSSILLLSWQLSKCFDSFYFNYVNSVVAILGASRGFESFVLVYFSDNFKYRPPLHLKGL